MRLTHGTFYGDKYYKAGEEVPIPEETTVAETPLPVEETPVKEEKKPVKRKTKKQ